MTYFRPGTYALVPNKHLLPQMKGAPLSVYVTLCAHADDEGICFPGIARICTMTGYSRPVVFRALQTLIDLDVIERHNRFGGDRGQDSNLYRILISGKDKGGLADDTGGSKKSHSRGIVHDTGGSIVHDTLTNPLELTQLTKGKSKNLEGSKPQPAEPPDSPSDGSKPSAYNPNAPGYKKAKKMMEQIRRKHLVRTVTSSLFVDGPDGAGEPLSGK